jgi:phage terminase large subunit-like protein
MSPATESFMRGVLAREIVHDCDPVLTWAVSNLVGHFDAKGNVYPKKARPELKIDPAIAAIMGKGRSMLQVC